MSDVWERRSCAGDDEWDKPDSHSLQKGDTDGWVTPPQGKADADVWNTPPAGDADGWGASLPGMSLLPSLSVLQMFACSILPSFLPPFPSFNIFFFLQHLFLPPTSSPPTFFHLEKLIIAQVTATARTWILTLPSLRMILLPLQARVETSHAASTCLYHIQSV